MNRFWSTILTIGLNISRLSSSMLTKIANQPLLCFVQLYVSLLSFLANGCCNYPVSTISTIRFNISFLFVGRSLFFSSLFLMFFFLMPSFLSPCGWFYLLELFLFPYSAIPFSHYCHHVSQTRHWITSCRSWSAPTPKTTPSPFTSRTRLIP